MNSLLLTDFYKTEHQNMYPKGMTVLYSNFTPRKSRISGVNEVVFFGLQHFILEYLIKHFETCFFARPVEDIIKEYSEEIHVNTNHVKDLHSLGYLPIRIKALPEGTLCPIGVPCLTIHNTVPGFGWLVNYLETLLSCSLWQPITSATIAREYKKILDKYALETTGTTDGVEWQAHDFSMRGMGSLESAILSGMGHLTSFTGSDVIPAIYQLKKSYNATGLIGASVPATEHSVMCMGGKEDEIETFIELLRKYPTGLLSVVSDTWDLWKVCTEYLPELKEQILARDGKLVIRPDSGDPVNILCGKVRPASKLNETALDVWFEGRYYTDKGGHRDFEHVVNNNPSASDKGVIELLWDVFGGTINEKGFKVLNPHIGAIYGDSITRERAIQICERLKAKGFASTNVVLGIGSYTYQYNTRDTFGFAMKATYGEVFIDNKGVDRREIFKDPITDDGTKRSAKGLLQVNTIKGAHGQSKPILRDQCTWEEESEGLLEVVFEDGKLIKNQSLDEIRKRVSQ